MPFSGRLSITDEQISALSRRDLLGKTSAIALAAVGAKLLPKLPTPKKYPSPEFKIGDLVASDWEPNEEDDDAPDSATDFGEILGMRWALQAESGCVAANTWLYYVLWTHSTSDCTCYPCYDGEPTRGCDLRLVKQS